MRLTELDVHQFTKDGMDGKTTELLGIAFLCPCCKKEYLCCFFEPTSYKDQRKLMSSIVNTEEASWVPCSSESVYAAANEHDLEKITIRPSINAKPVGHALVTISGGDVSH